MVRPPPRSTRTDTLFPYTTLFRSAMTFALSPWFGQQLTQVAVPISFAGAEAVDPAFAKDREQVMGGPFVDLERWRAEAPHARETLRAQLGWIDAVLSAGRPWLSGDAPGLLDIFAYPNLRSEARRVGKACVSTCRSRSSPSH